MTKTPECGVLAVAATTATAIVADLAVEAARPDESGVMPLCEMMVVFDSIGVWRNYRTWDQTT